MFTDQTIIGLDIGNDSIKMVEIVHAKKGNQLSTYGIANHKLDLEGYWDSSRLRQIGAIIEDLFNSGSFSGVKTVMSVQSKDVFVTTMDFEAGWSKKMIQDEIDRQAPYFLPYPPDEMRLSWSLIKNDPRIMNYTGKQRVIINALPDFVIENSKNLLEHVNLDGAALENQTISQIRAAMTPDQGNSVLVDVGAKHTTYSILVDGVLRSSSHVGVGTEKISLELASALGLEPQIAEFFKRDMNLVNSFHLPKQIVENLAVLKSELETFVELNKKIAQDPQKIVITGGGVYTPGFLQYFRDFPVPVYLGNCLRQVYIPEEIRPLIMPMVNQVSTAIGLGLREDV